MTIQTLSQLFTVCRLSDLSGIDLSIPFQFLSNRPRTSLVSDEACSCRYRGREDMARLSHRRTA